MSSQAIPLTYQFCEVADILAVGITRVKRRCRDSIDGGAQSTEARPDDPAKKGARSAEAGEDR